MTSNNNMTKEQLWVLEEKYQISKTNALMQNFTATQQIKNDLKLCQLGVHPAYIIGKWHFLDEDFVLLPKTLCPRPQTESLVQWIVDTYKGGRGLRILEIGSGSGCVVVSLLKMLPGSIATAVDISRTAIENTKLNAQRLGVLHRLKLVCSDFAKYPIKYNHFDIIVCNPPYIQKSFLVHINKWLKHYEDYRALFAGVTGVEFYEKLINITSGRLKRGCCMFLELGYNSLPHLQQTLQLHRQSIRPSLHCSKLHIKLETFV